MAPNNPLPTWGNEKTMNMNPLILTNIQASPYFKVNLYELKTYHEVIDEIYYKVDHLEPWEKGSRKTAGQTGMCGGVRGVGAGGIVSSAYCLLYKLYTLKLTRKQLMGLITHKDSPYIRGLGFMYIRYCIDPKEMWDWYEPYLDDEEEIDVKAGGGHKMTMGEVLRQWMVKLEWYSTLFPRIPVPIQKDLMQKLKEHPPQAPGFGGEEEEQEEEQYQPEEREEPWRARHIPDEEVSFGEAERNLHQRRSPDFRRSQGRSSPKRRSRSPRRRRSRSPRRSPDRRRSRSPYRRRHSPSRRRSRSPRNDFARELERERRRQERDRRSDRSRSRDRQKDKHRDRSRSKERPRHRSRSRSKDKMRQERSIHSGSKSHRSRSGSREPKRKKEKKHKHKSRSRERNSKHKSHSKHDRESEHNSPARGDDRIKDDL
uniref:Pre-mRNA-splicing factor 38 n=2 Tax=Crassostrea virginica TaxID=6565 RepID=A0A8B8DGB4_CRAVI|nr:pre-mRNA-splicing factor 38B-like isoform X1 [Crassostrea virginica]XP_022325991.1 pre-mRNA-splicing factor 38B-like isoform X1 [Crassostrea virginica]